MAYYLAIDSWTLNSGRFCFFIIILYGIVLADDMAHGVDMAQVDYERD